MVVMTGSGGDVGGGEIAFWKMSGSGNDFVVIDAGANTVPEDLAGFVRAVCHRRHGVGADGVVLIWPPDPGDSGPDALAGWGTVGSDATGASLGGLGVASPTEADGSAMRPVGSGESFSTSAVSGNPGGSGGGAAGTGVTNTAAIRYRWTYHNADGSEGEFCGNGAMCGARFAAHHGRAPVGVPFAFWTAAGCTEATVEAGGMVRLLLAPPGPVGPPVRVEVEGLCLDLYPITVGVPHAVLVAGSMDAQTTSMVRERFVAVGRAVRWHPAFAPAGTNLDLADELGEQLLGMRTYERGVEDETLACGSGAVAVALVAASLGLTRLPARVVTSGGPILTVAAAPGPGEPRRVTLGGGARLVASGTIHLEGLVGDAGASLSSR